MCSMQDDGGDHDGGRGLSDSKRAGWGLALLFFFWGGCFLFLGGWGWVGWTREW